MTIDAVMHKYSMSIDDVLNVRAMYGGTITIADDEHLAELSTILGSQSHRRLGRA